MAALTVDSTVGIGAKCFGDPAVTYPPVVALRREVDISKVALNENTNFAFMPIPKGFLATHIAVEQTKYADQSVTLTFATKNDATKAVGGNFTLAATSTKLRSCQPVKTTAAYAASSSIADTTSSGAVTTAIAIPDSMFFAADDILCIKVPDSLTGDKLTAGAFSVTLLGHMVFGESVDLAHGSTPLREKQQDTALDNVSGGPYNG